MTYSIYQEGDTHGDEKLSVAFKMTIQLYLLLVWPARK
jgi:hypothetical protein